MSDFRSQRKPDITRCANVERAVSARVAIVPLMLEETLNNSILEWPECGHIKETWENAISFFPFKINGLPIIDFGDTSLYRRNL